MSCKDCTCENNLKCGRKCEGACCQYMILPLHDGDHAKWASYHGVEILKIKGSNTYFAKFPNPCKYLTSEGRCGVFGTEKRPKMCADYWCDLAPEFEKVSYED